MESRQVCRALDREIAKRRYSPRFQHGKESRAFAMQASRREYAKKPEIERKERAQARKSFKMMQALFGLSVARLV